MVEHAALVDSQTPAGGEAFVQTEARPHSDDPVERLSWSLDMVGQLIFSSPEIRTQLAKLMSWPGRVSGWRRCGNVYAPDDSGWVYIFGYEHADPWPSAGTARLDPRSIVGAADAGVPLTVRSMRIPGRAVAVVASVCYDAGVGSLSELVGARTLPPVNRLAEMFPPGRGDAAGFTLDGERFDAVRASGIYVVSNTAGLETGVLLSDSTGAPRVWTQAASMSAIAADTAVSTDNRMVVTRDNPAPALLVRPYQLHSIRTAIVSSGRTAL